MKTIIRLLVATSAIVIGASSLQAGGPKTIGYFEAIEKEAAPVAGEQYYLRHGLRYESGKPWETTNYWTDTSILVPINTKVTLTSIGGNGMQIKIESSGQVLTINNLQKFSRKDTAEVAKGMLTRNEVPIGKFDDKTEKNIRNGILTLGMTKEQVVMTRGFPPGHKTPSLEIDAWTYWDNRFVTRAYVFQDGVLARGRGLY